MEQLISCILILLRRLPWYPVDACRVCKSIAWIKVLLVPGAAVAECHKTGA